MRHEPSCVYVFAEGATVDFYVYSNELNVQIDGFSLQGGFWHGSNITLDEAKGILEMAQAGVEDFGSQIPITDRTWDVY